jgi:histidine ammonia-lyase
VRASGFRFSHRVTPPEGLSDLDQGEIRDAGPGRLTASDRRELDSVAMKGPAEQLIELDGDSLTLEGLEAVARHQARVLPAPRAWDRMARSLEVILGLARGEVPAYGVNTGFGRLADVRISAEDVEALQRNVVRSHATGVGEPLDEASARALTLLRANVLLKGFSGVRPLIVERLCALLNSGVYPVVPSRGSVGASGDLAPLAHLALLLIGEGEGYLEGARQPGAIILFKLGHTPLILGPKEGIALVNGTQGMTALGALALLDAERLVQTADVAGALTLEGLRGTRSAFQPQLHALRPHPGQQKSAERLYALLSDSEIMESHKDCGKIQDAYSLRCMPQVHGAVRDTLAHARSVLEIELNAATDNPLVFADGEPAIIAGGNFHGAPVGYVCDFMAIALTDLAAMSERRIERLVNPDLSDLPPFLARDPGLESGLMMAQVTAAALVSESKALSTPKSVDSIPTSANREDHVSMGMTAALALAQVVDNVARVLAIELYCAAQALEFLKPLAPAKPLQAPLRRIHRVAPPLRGDRSLSNDIEGLATLVREGALLTDG